MFKNLKRQLDINGVSASSTVSQSNNADDDNVDGRKVIADVISEINLPSTSTSSLVLPLMAEQSQHLVVSTIGSDSRYRLLEQVYSEYRQKTAHLIEKKDSHLTRLQDRVANLENRLQQFESYPVHTNSIETERDDLKIRCDHLNELLAEQKISWTKEMDDQVQSDSSRLEALNVNNRSLEKQVDKLTKDNNDLKMNIEELHNSLKTLTRSTVTSNVCNSCSELKADVATFNARIVQFELSEDELQERLNELDNQLAQHKIMADDKQVHFDELLDQKLSLEDDAKTLRHQLEIEQEKICNLTKEVNLFRSNERKELQQDLLDRREIGTEQHISALANEVEDLHEVLDEKHRDLTVMYEQLREREGNCSKLEDQMKSFEATIERQRSVIESLQSEILRQREKNGSVFKERDDLLLRNASLSHQFETVKRDSRLQQESLSGQLNELEVALEQHQHKVVTNNNSPSTNRSNELQRQLAQRDQTIKTLNIKLADITRTFGVDDCSIMCASNAKEYVNSEQYKYLRNVLLKFVTSAESDALHMVKALSTLLSLTSNEEYLINETLKWKMSWLPSKRPALPPRN